MCEFFKREHQRVGSTPAMSERLDGLVELVHQQETGQYEPHTFRLLQSDAHIFNEVLDEKSRIEVSLKNTWSEMSRQQLRTPPRRDSSIGSVGPPVAMSKRSQTPTIVPAITIGYSVSPVSSASPP